MDQTANYQLPQWGAADPVRTGDFNGAMAGIDTALVKAGAALTEERTARAQADAALSRRVDTAQDTADRALAALPYVVGTYTGDGAETRHITVGFRPSFLIIGGMKEVGENYSTTIDRHTVITAGNNIPNLMKLTGDGFTVQKSYKYTGSSGTKILLNPALNYTDIVYDYIAFR